MKIQGMKRFQEQLLNEYLELFPVVAVIGARQVGKSTLVRQKKDWEFYDLEVGADFEQISRDPDHFLRLHSDQVIFDEAQIFPDLFPALRVAVDQDRQKKGRFIITGSSSPELLSSISESLAGRIGIIELSPFSLHEVYQKPKSLFDSIIQEKKIDESFTKSLKGNFKFQDIRDFWLRGGYPEPWIENTQRFRQVWMDNYVTTYLQRDLKRLFPRVNDVRFRKFLSILSGLSGEIVNYSEIARTLDVSQPIAKDYFHIAHHTFIWRNIPSFQKDSRKRLIKHPKGYLRDSGILNHLQRVQSLEQLDEHPYAGRLWECFVIEEVLKSLDTYGLKYDYSYYRTAAGAEVDLVLVGPFGLLPIEIKSGSQLGKRTIRNMEEFMSEFSCSLGLIINNDTKCRWYTENILGVPMQYL